ncbi:hypothetical protein [Mycoplasma bradburyae]|uniref:hypothetical protein n=1 Tax=Mycoplasma bradburyae TaxID=2963128 RepID=UPI0023414113|nr:hypothetical protein [Mycoplasma bradburyae]MDC4182469.1 hypothetical protein [Mycoplasma bradburyae]
MKTKNILKFISLLGVGSFVVLSAASCKTETAVKPKPMKPNPIPEKSDGSSSGDSSEVTDTITPPTGTDSGSLGNNNTGMSGNNDVVSNEEATSFLNSLTASELEVYSNGAVANRKDINVELFKVNKDSVKLKNESLLPKGWTYGVNLIDNSKNKEEGSIKVKVTLTKDSQTLSSNDITLNGFQTLATAVSSVLFKQQSVKGEDGMMVNKDVLDLGDAKFKTLSKLNSNVVIVTEGQPVEAAAPGTPTTMGRTSLREEASAAPEASNPPASTTNQEQTTVLGAEFKSLITKEESPFKIGFDKVRQLYPEFDVNKLYLTGQAKLVSLFKKDIDWKGTYYLVSKEEGKKLTLKLKDKDDWSLEIPGLVVQNLLPDDVKINVGSIDDSSITFNPEMQSNLEAYKEKMMTESTGTKYQFDSNSQKLSIKLDDNKIVTINPLKLPHVGSDKIDKIYFRAKYIFDGKQIEDGDIFGTKLVFKKIFKQTESSMNALSSNEFVQNYNGVSSIPGRQGDNEKNWNVEALKRVTYGNRRNENIINQFFSKDDSNLDGFNQTISGNENNFGKKGVLQLFNNTSNNYTTSFYGKSTHITKIDSTKATTFITFSRISYKKDGTNFSYLWPNSVTVLRFAGNSEPN